MKFLKYTIPFALATLFTACSIPDNREREKKSKAEMLKAELLNSNTGKIMVIAHRGDWRNAPENSLQAIQNCIDMGVDMVEVDVRLTKDSVLVLMHDKKIDRTTTGKGKLSKWTYNDLQKLYLKNGANHATHHKVPTLKEAMLVAKDQILINLDKCYPYFALVYDVLEETNTTKQVIMKGKVPVEQVNMEFGQFLDDVFFMPVVELGEPDAEQVVLNYQEKLSPIAYEFIFTTLESPVFEVFPELKASGSRIWVNALWESLNAGYEDDMAVHNPDSIYGWYVDMGINMIQTDRPRLLLDYLRKNGLHD